MGAVSWVEPAAIGGVSVVEIGQPEIIEYTTITEPTIHVVEPEETEIEQTEFETEEVEQETEEEES